MLFDSSTPPPLSFSTSLHLLPSTSFPPSPSLHLLPWINLQSLASSIFQSSIPSFPSSFSSLFPPSLLLYLIFLPVWSSPLPPLPKAVLFTCAQASCPYPPRPAPPPPYTFLLTLVSVTSPLPSLFPRPSTFLNPSFLHLFQLQF